MPTQYRAHCGYLADSLKTTVQVKNFSGLFDILKEQNYWLKFTPRDVTVKKYGEGIDERCGWDTHLVCIKGEAVGMTDGAIQ